MWNRQAPYIQNSLSHSRSSWRPTCFRNHVNYFFAIFSTLALKIFVWFWSFIGASWLTLSCSSSPVPLWMNRWSECFSPSHLRYLQMHWSGASQLTPCCSTSPMPPQMYNKGVFRLQLLCIGRCLPTLVFCVATHITRTISTRKLVAKDFHRQTSTDAQRWSLNGP